MSKQYFMLPNRAIKYVLTYMKYQIPLNTQTKMYILYMTHENVNSINVDNEINWAKYYFCCKVFYICTTLDILKFGERQYT